jgi:hypothetical protein
MAAAASALKPWRRVLIRPIRPTRPASTQRGQHSDKRGEFLVSRVSAHHVQ